MDKEIWKTIPDFEDYQVSNVGRVRHNGKILSPYLMTKPKSKRVVYAVMIKGKHRRVARLVASAFLGKSNLTVNHIDGNTLNNCAWNLEYCTLKENISKGYENGQFASIHKPIQVFDKGTGKTTQFRGLGVAERYYNLPHDYFGKRLRKGKHETDRFVFMPFVESEIVENGN